METSDQKHQVAVLWVWQDGSWHQVVLSGLNTTEDENDEAGQSLRDQLTAGILRGLKKTVN